MKLEEPCFFASQNQGAYEMKKKKSVYIISLPPFNEQKIYKVINLVLMIINAWLVLYESHNKKVLCVLCNHVGC